MSHTTADHRPSTVWRSDYAGDTTAVLNAVDDALAGSTRAFDYLSGSDARRAGQIYADCVRQGHELASVASSSSPRPAKR
jgi:hypothetical protein